MQVYYYYIPAASTSYPTYFSAASYFISWTIPILLFPGFYACLKHNISIFSVALRLPDTKHFVGGFYCCLLSHFLQPTMCHFLLVAWLFGFSATPLFLGLSPVARLDCPFLG